MPVRREGARLRNLLDNLLGLILVAEGYSLVLARREGARLRNLLDALLGSDPYGSRVFACACPP